MHCCIAEFLLSLLLAEAYGNYDVLEDCNAAVSLTKPAVICTKLIPDNQRCNDYDPAIKRLCPYWCGKCSDYSCGISGSLDCIKLKNEGKCTSASLKVRRLMKAHCAGVCGLCKTPITKSSLYSDSCSDKDIEFCRNNARNCEKDEVYDLLTDVCPATCNRCFDDSDDTALLKTLSGNTATDGCVDRMSNCATAYKVFCHNPAYSDIMQTYCPFTCNLCNSTNVNSSGQDCFDEKHSCSMWALNGYCSNPAFPAEMRRINCAKTCGFC